MFDDVIDFIRSIYGKEANIPLHEPSFLGNEKLYLNECIDSTYVSSVGEYVNFFEKRRKMKLNYFIYFVSFIKETKVPFFKRKKIIKSVHI